MRRDQIVSDQVTGAPMVRARYVSVDVWDTLLRRRCDPEATKLFTCWALVLIGADAIEPGSRDMWALLERRQAIERQLAQVAMARGEDAEYRLADVLTALVDGAWRADTGAEIKSGLVERLCALELKQEIFVTVADDEIASELAGHADAMPFFLSDFYMGADALRTLLVARGFSQVAKLGFVSCDVGMNKRSGRLYAHARDALGIDPAAWLHIGDNPAADVAAAERFGIQARHFVPEASGRARVRRERGFGRSQKHLRTGLQRAHEAVDEAVVRSGGEAALPMRLGAQCAPMLAGFGLWVLEQAVMARAKTIYFSGPHALMLGRCYQQIAEIYGGVLPAAQGRVLRAQDIITVAGSDPIVVVSSDGRDGAVARAAQLPPGGSVLGLQFVLTGDAPFGDGRVRCAGFAVDGHNGDAVSAREAVEPVLNELLRDDVDTVPFWHGCLLGVRMLAEEMRTHTVSAADVRVRARYDFASLLRARANQTMGSERQWLALAMSGRGIVDEAKVSLASMRLVVSEMRGQGAARFWVPARMHARREISRLRGRLRARFKR